MGCEAPEVRLRVAAEEQCLRSSGRKDTLAAARTASVAAMAALVATAAVADAEVLV